MKPTTMPSIWFLCTDAKMAGPDSDRFNHAIAIAEQVTYREEARMDALGAPAFA